MYQLGKSDFPPLKSLYRTNLPVPATPFLGRAEELASVVELLRRDEVRLLTLSGPGGTGKTRLALQAAAEVAEAFPDGITWVPLAPLRDASVIAFAAGQALGVLERPEIEPVEALVEAVQGKAALLLLDNARAPAAWGGGRSGATCRRRWPDGAGHEPRAAARARRAGLAGAAAVRCRRGGALPGPGTSRGRRLPAVNGGRGAACAPGSPALGGRAGGGANGRLRRLRELLERIGERLDLLEGPRDADSPSADAARHDRVVVRAARNKDERELLRALERVRRGCDFEAAEQVCAATPDAIQPPPDKSLVRHRPDATGRRYFMLETIREFAAEQLLQAYFRRRRSALRHAQFFDAMGTNAGNV